MANAVFHTFEILDTETDEVMAIVRFPEAMGYAQAESAAEIEAEHEGGHAYYVGLRSK